MLNLEQGFEELLTDTKNELKENIDKFNSMFTEEEIKELKNCNPLSLINTNNISDIINILLSECNDNNKDVIISVINKIKKTNDFNISSFIYYIDNLKGNAA